MYHDRKYNILFVLLLGTVLPWLPGNSWANEPVDLRHIHQTLLEVLENKSITDEQAKLLDLAFESASAIPLQPHVKSRSLYQEKVLETAVALGQLKWALAQKEEIKDWRRATITARVAAAAASQGLAEHVLQPLIVFSLEVAHSPGLEDWRIGKIRTQIGQVYAWLGDYPKANEYQSGASAHEMGQVALVKAQRCQEDQAPELMAELDVLCGSPRFEVIFNGIQGYLALMRHPFVSDEMCLAIEQKIQETWKVIPEVLQMQSCMGLAKTYLHRSNPEKAREWLSSAASMMGSLPWPIDLGIIRLAELAELYHQSGQADKAQATMDTAWSKFTTHTASIINIDRTEVLLPMAKTAMGMAQHDLAREIYHRALDESQVNPNSRPRAEDLSLIAASMAETGFTPTHEMLMRMQAMRQGFRHPW